MIAGYLHYLINVKRVMNGLRIYVKIILSYFNVAERVKIMFFLFVAY